eukprot:TRINITY_DN9643_c0_g2_i1.p1 TRINITY_DN9643_c0_g2~~TRINITY_DN9643_c0_g2_i1.p1  ORF type:complete len:668 (+),score=72.24 TRINITY_DN9643_c0_g2_i1:78-2081(+)
MSIWLRNVFEALQHEQEEQRITDVLQKVFANTPGGKWIGFGSKTQSKKRKLIHKNLESLKAREYYLVNAFIGESGSGSAKLAAALVDRYDKVIFGEISDVDCDCTFEDDVIEGKFSKGTKTRIKECYKGESLKISKLAKVVDDLIEMKSWKELLRLINSFGEDEMKDKSGILNKCLDYESPLSIIMGLIQRTTTEEIQLFQRGSNNMLMVAIHHEWPLPLFGEILQRTPHRFLDWQNSSFITATMMALSNIETPDDHAIIMMLLRAIPEDSYQHFDIKTKDDKTLAQLALLNSRGCSIANKTNTGVTRHFGDYNEDEQRSLRENRRFLTAAAIVNRLTPNQIQNQQLLTIMLKSHICWPISCGLELMRILVKRTNSVVHISDTLESFLGTLMFSICNEWNDWMIVELLSNLSDDTVSKIEICLPSKSTMERMVKRNLGPRVTVFGFAVHFVWNETIRYLLDREMGEEYYCRTDSAGNTILHRMIANEGPTMLFNYLTENFPRLRSITNQVGDDVAFALIRFISSQYKSRISDIKPSDIQKWLRCNNGYQLQWNSNYGMDYYESQWPWQCPWSPKEFWLRSTAVLVNQSFICALWYLDEDVLPERASVNCGLISDEMILDALMWLRTSYQEGPLTTAEDCQLSWDLPEERKQHQELVLGLLSSSSYHL